VTAFAPGHTDRAGFCDHTAAGYMRTLKDPGFWNRAGVSAHFAISKTGEIVQLVNIFDTAWTQGRLGPRVTWPPFDTMGGGNPNAYLISTEHEDETELNMRWPEAMYEADLRVKRWCIDECRSRGMDVMRFAIDSLAGHFMFDGVDRANCPGSGWPRERLFADLIRQELPEVYHPHDAWALEGLKLAGGSRTRIEARQVFRLPSAAHRISIEWMSKRGYGIVYHGGTDAQAGRFGWSQAREAAEGYSHTPGVTLDEHGGFDLYAEDGDNPVELLGAHVTAWW
jgi:hypothetical protein